jgi:outer membrane lipoprotein-sorting protein
MLRILSLLAVCLLFTSLATAQTAEDIMNKYTQAMGMSTGGAQPFSTMSMDMTMSMQSMSMDGTMKIKHPDKMRYEMNMMGNKAITVINGTDGWASMGGQVYNLPKDQLQQSKMMGSGDYVSQMKAQGYTFKYLGKDGNDHKLQGDKAGAEGMYMYFDATTHLLSRIEPNKGEGTMYISDYRKVGTILFPHQMQMKTAQGEMKISYSNVQLDKEIPDSEFSKPN